MAAPSGAAAYFFFFLLFCFHGATCSNLAAGMATLDEAPCKTDEFELDPLLSIFEASYVQSEQDAGMWKVVRLSFPKIFRLKNMHKHFHVGKALVALRKVKKSSLGNFLPSKHPDVQLCLHRDANTNLGVCPQGWLALDKKGTRNLSMSLFDENYLDIRSPSNGDLLDQTIHVEMTEEFQLFRVFFFVTGFAMFIMAPFLSQWLFFYYGSGMLLGVLLILIVIIYQTVRLLPTGRKGTWYIIFFGSLIGMGSLVLNLFLDQISKAFQEFGISEDTSTPIAIVCTVMIALVGAALGFWAVRKLLLTEQGALNPPVVHFVKWGMRILGLALLSQSSIDLPQATLATLLVVATSSLHVMPQLFVSWRRKRRGQQPRRTFAPTVQGNYGRGFMPAHIQRMASPSAYHHSPSLRLKSRVEAERISRECTQAALRALVGSSSFRSWVLRNLDCIVVAPPVRREERTEEEIRATADMGEEDGEVEEIEEEVYEDEYDEE